MNTESHYGDGIPATIEPIGAEDCTAFSTVKVAFSQTKKNYDVNMLWNAVPKSQDGANPMDTLRTAINDGLYNLATNLFEKIWSNFFDATVGVSDAFTNTCANMDIAQSSAMINGQWYEEWNVIPPNSVMPVGQTLVSYHSYVFVDYTTVNGERVAIIDAHQGYHLLMPANVFNIEVAKNTVGCLMPTNATINARRTIPVMQWIVELMQQVVLLYTKLLA